MRDFVIYIYIYILVWTRACPSTESAGPKLAGSSFVRSNGVFERCFRPLSDNPESAPGSAECRPGRPSSPESVPGMLRSPESAPGSPESAPCSPESVPGRLNLLPATQNPLQAAQNPLLAAQEPLQARQAAPTSVFSTFAGPQWPPKSLS